LLAPGLIFTVTVIISLAVLKSIGPWSNKGPRRTFRSHEKD